MRITEETNYNFFLNIDARLLLTFQVDKKMKRATFLITSLSPNRTFYSVHGYLKGLISKIKLDISYYKRKERFLTAK